jgi:hypothetical protein
MFPLKAFHWGHKGARDNFSLQIRNIVEESYKSLGEVPVQIGECGIPMDMKCVSIIPYLIRVDVRVSAKEKRLPQRTSAGRDA